jgi:pimeloyl-ACP methyl ester carboxylesterase
MPKSTTVKHAADYIAPLYMNGLQGRMLRVPGPKTKNRDILFVYGNRSSLERWWGVIEDLSQYGTVTAPDLPGFGGMQSFYKIGQKPTIDAYADYLAAFVKMRYKRKRITIAGMSFGFVIVTRMLQRYPDLAKRVDMLVSVAGFTHHDDFTFTPGRHRFYYYGAKFFSWRLPAFLYKHILLSPSLLRLGYARTHNAKHKFVGLDRADQKRMMEFEIQLWQSNDPRTQMATTAQFLRLDNCNKRVDLPVWHVSPEADNYFDKHMIEQHMNVIFNGYKQVESKLVNHAPTMIGSKEEARPLFPTVLRRVLARSPGK